MEDELTWMGSSHGYSGAPGTTRGPCLYKLKYFEHGTIQYQTWLRGACRHAPHHLSRFVGKGHIFPNKAEPLRRSDSSALMQGSAHA